MKKTMMVLMVIAVSTFSCVPADRAGVTPGGEPPQGFHDSYFDLSIEGRLERSGSAVECEIRWGGSGTSWSCPATRRTNLGQRIYDYEGPLPIEPLIGALVTECYDQLLKSVIEEDAEIYSKCVWMDGDVQREFDFTNPQSEPFLGSDDLQQNFCAQQVLLCLGHKLMEIASAVGPFSYDYRPVFVTVTEVEVSGVAQPNWLVQLAFDLGFDATNQRFYRSPCIVDDGYVRIQDCTYHFLIPPQSAANKSLLFLAALSSFREAAYRGTLQLRYSSSVDYLVDQSDLWPQTPTTLLDHFITSHTETVHLYIEAVEKLVRNQVAVSVSYPGDSPDLATARDMEWNGPINSRSAALRIMYEGEPPWTDLSATHFNIVDIEPGARGVREAISLIMKTGVGLPAEDSDDAALEIAQKIANAYYEDTCWLGDFRSEHETLLGKLDLDMDDLLLAVRYLQQEQEAFRRPMVPLDPVEHIEDMTPCNEPWSYPPEPRYATIKRLPFNPPERLFISEYSTRAWSSAVVNRDRRYLAYSANKALVTMAKDSMSGISAIAEDDPDSPVLSYVPLLATAAQDAKNMSGNLFVMINYDEIDAPDIYSAHQVRAVIRLYGDAPFGDQEGFSPGCLNLYGFRQRDKILNEKLIAVQPLAIKDTSTAIYQCVTSGAVEGQPCVLENIATVYELEAESGCSGWKYGLWTGYRQYRSWLKFDFPAYIFRVAGGKAPELVAAWTAMSLKSNATYFAASQAPVNLYALGGIMEDWVADTLRRDIQNAGKVGRGAWSPPLENELISNSNEYEDSWRHYLDIAKESAAEADALGDQIIAAGLDMDLRAEAALNELEEICGGVMNIGQLCDPADPVTCPAPAECNGADVSGCESVINGGNGAQPGDVNPALSSCLPGGKNSRKADFVALGGPMCFWLDTSRTLCGHQGVKWNNQTEELPPCPIPRLDDTCDQNDFPGLEAVDASKQIVILGSRYALSQEEETLDTGVWLPDAPEALPKGWRLRFMGLFDSKKQTGDPPQPRPMPVCEYVRMLHRQEGCFDEDGYPKYNSDGEYLGSFDTCTGIWSYNGDDLWEGKPEEGVQGYVHKIIDHIQNQEGGWLTKEGLALALEQIYMDADLAHQYELYLGDRLALSTYARDVSSTQQEFIKLVARGSTFDEANFHVNDESERAQRGHLLQQALVELGFMAGGVRSIIVGRPGLAEIQASPVVGLDAADYQTFDEDLSLIAYCGDDGGPCPTDTEYHVAELNAPELLYTVNPCNGDGSCRCLYLNWPPMGSWDGELDCVGLDTVYITFCSLEDTIDELLDRYSDTEHMPCITGDADGPDKLSVRDDCEVKYNPDGDTGFYLDGLINNPAFWREVLYKLATGDLNATIDPAFGLPAGAASDLDPTNLVQGKLKYNRNGESCKTSEGDYRDCVDGGRHLKEPDKLLMKRAQEGSSHIELEDGGDRVVWKGPSDRDTFFWALELACETLHTDEGYIQCADFNPEDITKENIDNTGEIYKLTKHLQCSADAFIKAGERIVLQGIPEEVIKTAQTEAIETHQGEYGGQLLQVINAIETDLENLSEVLQDVSFELAIAGQDSETLRNTLKQLGLRKEIDRLRSAQQSVTYAASAISGFSSADPVNLATASIASALYAVAIVLEGVIANKTEQVTELEEDQAINDFETKMIYHLANLKDLYRNLGDTIKSAQNNLEEYDRLQRNAQRLVAVATFADSDPTGRVYNVNTVMRRRLNTLHARYEKRLDIAKKAAKRARKAIEFRTGINLSTETQELDLVPAPSTWVDSLDKLQGINYNEIRCVPTAPADEGGTGGENSTDSGTANTQCMAVDNYAEQYIGDWVALLEGYMESYSSAHPFSDGEDYAVASLKDDIFALKEFCSLEARNLFYYSEDLSKLGHRLGPETAPSGIVGWRVVGCPQAETSCVPNENCSTCPEICGTLSEDVADRCLTVRSFTSPEVPCGYFQDPAEGNAYGIYYCNGDYSEIFQTSDPDPDDSRVVQEVEDLSRGTYMMSWFDFDATPPASSAPSATYLVTLEVPGALEGQWVEAARFEVTESAISWVARRVLIQMNEPTDIRVGFSPVLPSTQQGSAGEDLDVTALQLYYLDIYSSYDNWNEYCSEESLSAGAGALESACLGTVVLTDPPELLPQPFEPTGASRLQPGMCPDEDGSALRQMLRRRCDYLCSGGFTESECSMTDPGAYPVWCYYEVPFHISLEEMERGETFASGAVAIGNFNYRHVEVGVNIVGTNVMDCSLVEFSTTCYANGFLQYSLAHGGSLSVRNHRGEDVSFYLPTAWIEHQKALNTETVLTNPASGGQRDQLADYMNREFWGRPLTGDYLLRIWDVDGLALSRIEDIQVVFKYHYWTRHTE